MTGGREILKEISLFVLDMDGTSGGQEAGRRFGIYSCGGSGRKEVSVFHE